MCIKNKYKVYTKITFSFLNFFPNRLKTFKRSKWKKVKLILTKRSIRGKNKLRLVDHFKVRKNTKRWDKLSLIYKKGNNLKRSVFQLFGNSLNIKYFKNQLKERRPSIIKLLVKPLYRLDVLLWKLRFYPTIKKAQQQIKCQKVLLNNKRIKKVCLLKRGDIIRVLDKDVVLKKNFLKTFFFFHFCEIDPYSNTFIILKDYKSITQEDLSLIYPEFVDLKHLIYYLRKK